MQWIMLLFAGLFEVTWAVSMKFANGFSKIIPSVITIIFYLLSAIFLSQALKKLPLGMAYAMWTGFGIVGTSLLGIFLFKEVLNTAQIISIALIICGIVGLKIM